VQGERNAKFICLFLTVSSSGGTFRFLRRNVSLCRTKRFIMPDETFHDAPEGPFLISKMAEKRVPSTGNGK
jgi:hypothetical protein